MNYITCFKFCYWKRIRDKDIFTFSLVYKGYRRGVCYWKRIRDKDIFTLPLVYQGYRRGGGRGLLRYVTQGVEASSITRRYGWGCGGYFRKN